MGQWHAFIHTFAFANRIKNKVFICFTAGQEDDSFFWGYLDGAHGKSTFFPRLTDYRQIYKSAETLVPTDKSLRKMGICIEYIHSAIIVQNNYESV